jgi:hypothetical protein
MRISKYFDTETDRSMITVTNPTLEQISNLTYLHACIVDKVREKFGAIIETSGLRPAKQKYSQHQDGLAADIVPGKANIHEVFEWIRDNLVFDQIILETNKQGSKWIHISLTKAGNRKQSLLGVWSNESNEMKYITA